MEFRNLESGSRVINSLGRDTDLSILGPGMDFIKFKSGSRFNPILSLGPHLSMLSSYQDFLHFESGSNCFTFRRQTRPELGLIIYFGSGFYSF